MARDNSGNWNSISGIYEVIAPSTFPVSGGASSSTVSDDDDDDDNTSIGFSGIGTFAISSIGALASVVVVTKINKRRKVVRRLLFYEKLISLEFKGC